MSSRPTVDGEYDPVVAAAQRKAARQQASQKREADRLRREAEAKKAAEKAATAARIAQIKAKQAETAAKLERTRLSAEKKAQAAAQRAQDRAARKATQTRVSGDKSAFDQVMKKARATSGTITDAGLKTKAGVENVLDTWAAQNDKLYSKGNFLTVDEKADLLKEVQKNPYLAYDVMTGTKPEKPPKTLDEALARMNYLVSEIALGGAREVALPFSLKAGQPRRVEDAILQVVGGLLTPSPADMLISNAFRALAGAGKKGTKILRKMIKGTDLTADEARQFEKLVGQYGYSTSDLRKAGSKLDDLSNTEWNELLKKYQKYYEFWEKNPDLYGAGAAYKPSALLEFEDLLDDLGYDAGEYIDYLKAHKQGATLNPATLIAFINGVKPPTLDPKAYEKIESDLEKYRESLLKKPKGTIVEDEEITLPTPIVEDEEITLPTPIVEDEEITLPTPIIEEEEEPPIPIPIIEEEEEPPIPIPIIEEDEDITIPTPIVEDEEEPPPPSDEPPPPVKPMKKGDPGSRPNVFHALIGGIKEEYRVKFDYKKGPSETFTVTARSFPQALQQAQQKRRVKYVPSEVDIAKRGK